MFSIFMTPFSEFDICYICKIFDTEDFVSFEQDDREDEALVYGVEDYTSPHLRCDNVFFSGVWHSFQELA